MRVVCLQTRAASLKASSKLNEHLKEIVVRYLFGVGAAADWLTGVPNEDDRRAFRQPNMLQPGSRKSTHTAVAIVNHGYYATATAVVDYLQLRRSTAPESTRQFTDSVATFELRTLDGSALGARRYRSHERTRNFPWDSTTKPVPVLRLFPIEAVVPLLRQVAPMTTPRARSASPALILVARLRPPITLAAASQSSRNTHRSISRPRPRDRAKTIAVASSSRSSPRSQGSRCRHCTSRSSHRQGK
jgi:hypothetical protein